MGISETVSILNAFVMDDALLKALLREKNARLRDQKEEINYLRDCLWQAGQDFSEPQPIPTRREEPVGKTILDSLVKELLEW